MEDVMDVRLTPEYIELQRDRDRLQRLLDGEAAPVAPRKKPEQPGHGMLNPTDGRSGRTTPSDR